MSPRYDPKTGPELRRTLQGYQTRLDKAEKDGEVARSADSTLKKIQAGKEVPNPTMVVKPNTFSGLAVSGVYDPVEVKAIRDNAEQLAKDHLGTREQLQVIIEALRAGGILK